MYHNAFEITYVDGMKAENFVKSWSALWLWMHELNKCLLESKVEHIYTFRKARLDIHFSCSDLPYKLSWEKRGNQALLIGSSQVTLPKRRIDIFRKLPAHLSVSSVQIHAEDRLLRINLQNDTSLMVGFYHAVLNIYLYQSGELIDTFLKQSEIPKITDHWLGADDILPNTIPGAHLESQELLSALNGIKLDPESQELSFSDVKNSEGMSIQDLTLSVLRNSQKPKAAPSVSLEKTGKTVLSRWKNKLKNIQKELREAESWPELEIKLQCLQIGMGFGQTPAGGIIDLPAELSPTGSPIQVQLASNTSILETIEATAKTIRKFKGKLIQLKDIPDKIQADINILDQLLDENNQDKLQTFLSEQGETLDRSGRQQSERKPYKKYASPGGFDILVGRSSSDNDTLTFKVAGKNDWWFHARQIRGSHVILKTGNQAPQPGDIKKAAEYAALNSKAKHSGIVVIQYCQRKHLSKPKGSHPGAVLVHHEKSITIDLDQLK